MITYKRQDRQDKVAAPNASVTLAQGIVNIWNHYDDDDGDGDDDDGRMMMMMTMVMIGWRMEWQW